MRSTRLASEKCPQNSSSFKTARPLGSSTCRFHSNCKAWRIIWLTLVLSPIIFAHLTQQLVHLATDPGQNPNEQQESPGQLSEHCTLKRVLRRSQLPRPVKNVPNAVRTPAFTGHVGGSGSGSPVSATVASSSRFSHKPVVVPNFVEITERALVCTKIDNESYNHFLDSFPIAEMNTSIHQLTITESDPQAVLSAISLICSYLNCTRLSVFNISGHEIHDTGQLLKWLGQWPRLEVLDLSNTSLASIDSVFTGNDLKDLLANNSNANQIHLNDMTHLDLSYNDISMLNFNVILESFPNLKHLSLVNNSISAINCSENLRSRVRSQFETISLSGNAISCDKNHLWIMRLIQSHLNNKFPDYEHIKCRAPEKWAEMTWRQRVSVLETPICDFCDCRALKRAAISVDCHNKSLTALPDVLPLNTKILNLTSNRIDSFGVPRLSRNWDNVTYVYLENNLISSFQPLESNSKFMRNLAALDIRRNKFREFPIHVFEQFINLDQVQLSDNPWLCDCETFSFQEWLQRQFQKVGDKEEIRCGVLGSDENGLASSKSQQRLSSHVIYRLSKSELCPPDDQSDPYEWLDVVNFLLSLMIVLIIIKVVLDYIYQHRTKRLPHFFKLNI